MKRYDSQLLSSAARGYLSALLLNPMKACDTAYESRIISIKGTNHEVNLNICSPSSHLISRLCIIVSTFVSVPRRDVSGNFELHIMLRLCRFCERNFGMELNAAVFI